MTPEEFDRAIEQILAMQRELQERQLRAAEQTERQSQAAEERFRAAEERFRVVEERFRVAEERLDRHDEQIANLLAMMSSQREDAARSEAKLDQLSSDIDRLARIVNQLVGYSLSNESEHLDDEERLRALEARARRLNGEEN